MVVTEKSTRKDKAGNKHLLTDEDLDQALARIHRGEDGRYRVLLSKYLDGVPIGGADTKGVRKDDINDVIPHEDRRSLRGLYVFFSWLQYTDVKEHHMLDMWVENPDHPGEHYVKHYLVDFGKSLGSFKTLSSRDADGHAYAVDLQYDMLSMVTLGLWKRPWEGTRDTGIEGLAPLDAEHFEPNKWKPHFPFFPFDRKDDYDGFWGAKIVMSFSPAHIKAAIEQGRFQDPDAVDYLLAAVVGRQRKIGRLLVPRGQSSRQIRHRHQRQRPAGVLRRLALAPRSGPAARESQPLCRDQLRLPGQVTGPARRDQAAIDWPIHRVRGRPEDGQVQRPLHHHSPRHLSQ